MAQSSSIRAFDPKMVTINWGAHLVEGFAEEKVTISFQDDAFDLAIGCDGEASRVRKNNNSATITLTLQQTSQSNDVFSYMAIADRQANAGILPMTIIDYSGTTKLFAPSSYIVKTPDQTLSNTNNTMQWVFVCDNLGWFAGGSAYDDVGTLPSSERLGVWQARNEPNVDPVGVQPDPLGLRQIFTGEAPGV
jgi:2-polyprenyl-6-methoxyphenol hydroxylase-like FAD-dependent oxidoreductase